MQPVENKIRKQYYEKLLQTHPVYKEILMCLKKEDDSSLYNMVFLPVLMEYISWVLIEAQKSGKKRLYFLARDGYQMYLVAKKLCEIQELPIECRYLKVSRYSMRLPEYHLLGDKCVDYICVGGIDVTVERIIKRAGLPEEMAKKIMPNTDTKKILNYNEVMEIKEQLRSNEVFLAQVFEVSKMAYQPAMEYLKQEGLFDKIEFALVDSGWVGTLQKTIAHLISRPNLEGYYFGMYETPKDINESCYHAFYFTPKRGMARKVSFSNCLFEAVFTSPDGMTIRYEKKDDRYIPVTDFQKNPNEVQITKNCICLDAYLDIYKMLLKNDRINSKDMCQTWRKKVHFVEKILSKCMGQPTDWEVQSVGNLLFSDDVLEGNLKKVAADLTSKDIRAQRFINKALIMTGIKKEELHESAWIEGSIVRNGESVRSNLFHAKLYKYFVYIRKLMK